MRANETQKDEDVERRLFHGTDKNVVNAICRENFDWRVCGKNATAFGQGNLCW